MDTFVKLYERLLEIDFFATAGVPLPRNTELRQVIDEGSLHLPLVYLDSYVTLLEAGLPRLFQLISAQQLPVAALETLSAAVYLHRLGAPLSAPLQRFQAVVSNFFRSFLSSEKRSKANIPLRERLAPLAMFQHDPSLGPFAFTVDEVSQLIGANVGVLSLPASYAADPLIWAVLAHETGGHIVTHSDPGLLEQLANSIPLAIAGMPTSSAVPREVLTLLWSYWIDEAVADVYGILNIGPAFTLNMAAYFAAAEARGASVPPSFVWIQGLTRLTLHKSSILTRPISFDCIWQLVRSKH